MSVGFELTACEKAVVREAEEINRRGSIVYELLGGVNRPTSGQLKVNLLCTADDNCFWNNDVWYKLYNI